MSNMELNFEQRSNLQYNLLQLMLNRSTIVVNDTQYLRIRVDEEEEKDMFYFNADSTREYLTLTPCNLSLNDVVKDRASRGLLVLTIETLDNLRNEYSKSNK